MEVSEEIMKLVISEYQVWGGFIPEYILELTLEEIYEYVINVDK